MSKLRLELFNIFLVFGLFFLLVTTSLAATSKNGQPNIIFFNSLESHEGETKIECRADKTKCTAYETNRSDSNFFKSTSLDGGFKNVTQTHTEVLTPRHAYDYGLPSKITIVYPVTDSNDIFIGKDKVSNWQHTYQNGENNGINISYDETFNVEKSMLVYGGEPGKRYDITIGFKISEWHLNKDINYSSGDFDKEIIISEAINCDSITWDYKDNLDSIDNYYSRGIDTKNSDKCNITWTNIAAKSGSMPYIFKISPKNVPGSRYTLSPYLVSIEESNSRNLTPVRLVPSPSSTQNPKIIKPLSLGSTGQEVLELQDFLIQKGFLVMPQGVPKGYYGNLTDAAVTTYKRQQTPLTAIPAIINPTSPIPPTVVTPPTTFVPTTSKIPTPTASVIVTPTVPPATVSLTANPSSITSGGGVILSWHSTGATSCTSNWGIVGTNGSTTVYPTSSFTYVISYVIYCTNSVGVTTKATALVTVNPPVAVPAVAPTASLTSTPTATQSVTVTTSRRESIRQLYLTLLKREPDIAGLDYWTSTSYTLEEVKQAFINGAEYQNLIKSSASPSVSASADIYRASLWDAIKALFGF